MLISAIVLDGENLQFETVTWKNYWGEFPETCHAALKRLEKSWRSYIAFGFSSEYATLYGDAMLELLKIAVVKSDSIKHKTFLTRVLGFENIALRYTGEAVPFAAVTTTFRNPFLAMLDSKGIRVGAREYTKMLPLILLHNRGKVRLFYHYRKQRILKNSDEALLFFLAEEPEKRVQSFCGLDKLTNTLTPQWDSRIEERAELLGTKVLAPCLTSLKRNSKALRVLDIGAGDGLFTDRVITKILDSGVLSKQKMELSLLDVVAGLPGRQSGSAILLNGLSKVERIACDYRSWLQACRDRYDVAFIFRMLHNFSRFEVRVIVPPKQRMLPGNKYPVLRHMSKYYQALLRIFPHLNSDGVPMDDAVCYHPFRGFEQNSLVMPDGTSLLEQLCGLADYVFIEDGDLCAKDMLQHLVQHQVHRINVQDFSKHLRLLSNHVYVLSKSKLALPFETERLWP